MHGVCDDFDLLLHAANVERDIEAELVVHFYFDIRLGERAESGRCHRKLINSGWQRQNAKRTIGTRNGFLLEIGLPVDRDNFRTGNHGVATVAHHAQNRSGHISAQNVCASENH